MGAGPAGAGVAAGVGFGQPEPGQRAARAEVRQPPLALLLGAVRRDRCRAEPDGGLEGDRHRRVDARDLLDGDAQRGEVGVRTAVLHRERQPEQTEPPHRVDGVDGELVVPVPSLRLWGDLLLREVADDLAKCFVFLGEVEVH